MARKITFCRSLRASAHMFPLPGPSDGETPIPKLLQKLEFRGEGKLLQLAAGGFFIFQDFAHPLGHRRP